MGTYAIFEIGKVYHGCRDNTGKHWPEQPFLVLREVTYDDWEACAKDNNVKILPEVRAAARSGKARFYGISTD